MSITSEIDNYHAIKTNVLQEIKANQILSAMHASSLESTRKYTPKS